MNTKVQAYQKYIRVSPRKLKVLAKSVKEMNINNLLTNLKFTNKKTARILYKVIKQAVSNAKQKQVDLNQWSLDTIQVLKGPTYKRWRAVSRGRGHSIFKRTSHLKVVLRLDKPKDKKEPKNKKPPVKSATNIVKKAIVSQKDKKKKSKNKSKQKPVLVKIKGGKK